MGKVWDIGHGIMTYSAVSPYHGHRPTFYKQIQNIKLIGSINSNSFNYTSEHYSFKDPIMSLQHDAIQTCGTLSCCCNIMLLLSYISSWISGILLLVALLIVNEGSTS